MSPSIKKSVRKPVKKITASNKNVNTFADEEREAMKTRNIDSYTTPLGEAKYFKCHAAIEFRRSVT